MQSLLITGGCGFIGTNLVRYLLQNDDYHIRILDSLSSGRKEYLDRILNSTESANPVELVVGDIRDVSAVERAVAGVDAVIHLAAISGIAESLKDPKGVYQVNVMGTLNLLEACRKHNVDRFVLASSNAVVGEKEPPIHEEMVPAPISPYGASKLACEGLCGAYHGSFGIKAIALRFSNVYGPYCDHKTSVIPRFIRWAKQGKPLVIYGDGTQTRDFIHASDIARAIELALDYNPTSHGELVFQIASGREARIIDLAEKIRKLAQKSDLISPEITFQPARRGEIQRNYADISKARELLRYQPEVDLERGLKETWLAR